MKRVSLIIAGLALVTVFSCSKKPDTGGTATESMANEWWAELILPDGTTNANGAGYFGHIFTYNSSANTNEIWIEDPNELYNFKVKATADLGALTFSANNVTSVVPGYDIKVTITEGKIIQNGGHSKTGNVTDSIYMKVKFEDDARTFTIRGHARTRFSEDDY
jgi:hypothetical protein